MKRLFAAALLALASLGHAQTALVPGTYTCTNCTIVVTPPSIAASAPASTASSPATSTTPSIAPLPSISVTAGSMQGVDAPSDSDIAAGYGRFYEKGLKVANGTYVSNSTFGFTPTSLSQFSTISVAGTPRFMYEPTDGLPAFRETIVRGDLQYPSGLRAGRSFEGASSVDGESVWVALAVKYDASWAGFVQTSGQSCEILALHSGGTGLAPFYGVQLMMQVLPVKGGQAQKPAAWLTVPKRDGSGDAGLYNWAPNYGGWQRLILHYVTGPSGLVELWVANGTGAFTQLQPVSWGNNGNVGNGTVYSKNLAYGDPTAGGGSQGKDFLKVELYTADSFTGMPNNTATLHVSGVYDGKTANGWGFANAVAAVAAYAR